MIGSLGFCADRRVIVQVGLTVQSHLAQGRVSVLCELPRFLIASIVDLEFARLRWREQCLMRRGGVGGFREM